MNSDILGEILQWMTGFDIKSLAMTCKVNNISVANVLINTRFFPNRLKNDYERISNPFNQYLTKRSLKNVAIYQSLLCRTLEIIALNFDEEYITSQLHQDMATKNLRKATMLELKKEYPEFLLAFTNTIHKSKLFNIVYFLQENDRKYIRFKGDTYYAKCAFLKDPRFFAEWICYSSIADIIELSRQIIRWTIKHLEVLDSFLTQCESLGNYFYSCGIVFHIIDHLWTGKEERLSLDQEKLLEYCLKFLIKRRVSVPRINYLNPNVSNEDNIRDLINKVFLKQYPIISNFFGGSFPQNPSSYNNKFEYVSRLEKILDKRLTTRGLEFEGSVDKVLKMSNDRQFNQSSDEKLIKMFEKINFATCDWFMEMFSPSIDEYYLLLTNAICKFDTQCLLRLLLDNRAETYNFTEYRTIDNPSNDNINSMIKILRSLSNNSPFNSTKLIDYIALSGYMYWIKQSSFGDESRLFYPHINSTVSGDQILKHLIETYNIKNIEFVLEKSTINFSQQLIKKAQATLSREKYGKYH